MKMDHHGSSAETFFKKRGVARVSLEELPMTQFRPRNIIVTPGSRHGHPNDIQFLKYLIKPVINWGDNDSDPMKSVGRLFGTKTPYWAVKSSLGKTDINFKYHENTSIIRSKELIRFIGKGHFDAATGNSMEAISQVFTSEILWTLDYWAGQIAIELDMLLQQTPPKPESKKIGQELKEETEEIRISLLDYLVADFENRRNIQFMGQESWNELSAQTIQESLLGVAPPKTAYFLIRFTFIDGTPRKVCWVDQLETGVLINSIRIFDDSEIDEEGDENEDNGEDNEEEIGEGHSRALGRCYMCLSAMPKAHFHALVSDCEGKVMVQWVRKASNTV
ncbi:hypothetical protein FOYG_04089 [Fusarium oxysporum NRRL 32931]|uniref:Uncharacterized protein n=1 Tax=Fusarium oxysporum NRRL 32931 TaxID=660029 RepID=W9IR07_FUSOX|nr:hypothetical protein FOYG_04089 [Fusarium oxysporum NRRL 32931]